ncbi:Thymidylate kinase [uncultured archaeon]|nr:Thymidylate kinase [uncultured archaeon]
MTRGRLIVVEGTDCSGKETQTKLLYERLRAENFPVASMSFPRYETSTGKIVGECYLGKSGKSWFESPTTLDPRIASLYYAADRLAARDEIEKTLASGTNLVLNRYVESNMGHQGGKAKTPEEREQIVNFIRNLEYKLLGLPKPDQVVFLYMPYQVGMELKKGRAGIADAHEASEEHLRQAEQAYLWIARNFNWTKINCTTDGTFEGLRTREEIAEEVHSVALRVI